MSTCQEDFRRCQAVVAQGAARLERAEAFRRKARAEFRALLKAGKVSEIIPPAMAGRPTKITPEIRARVIAARKSGVRLKAIALAEHLGLATVARIIYRTIAPKTNIK